MKTNPEDDSSIELVDRVDRALQSFWRGSPGEFDRLISDEDSDDTAVCGLLAGLIEENANTLDVPERIGDYAINRQIGRGGMATVYEARQERTGRIVALKLIRRWGATDRAQFRVFRREVDMLARLKHPAIATLYDAGITDEGQHYFALELATGLTLAEYMQRHRTDRSAAGLRERLELCCKICRAMNYAHQRGVIHRDLKPSNIFVAADGQPKILDFGLARLLDNDPAVTASYSEGGRIVGTLQYMSPEQASGDPNDLDIRSDVYSLGVILFEMLTGERPYPVRRMALPEAVRNICETDPRRPSLIDYRLKGDLETIVLKALEKAPDRRYQSSAALAEDVERYLADKPILARAPSAAYHLRKLITRHKLPAALIAALFVLTTAFAVVFAVQASQVVEERDSARAAAHRAEKANEFLGRMLEYMDPTEVGNNIPIREVLDKAAADLDSEFQDQPEVCASLHETIGRSYRVLKLFEPAERHLTAALDLRGEIFGERHPAYASSLNELGMLAGVQHQEKADELLFAALELRRDLLGDSHPAVASSLHDISIVRCANGDYREAVRYARESLDMRRRLLGEHRETAESLQQLANLLTTFGQFDEAEAMLHEALDMQRKLLGENHSDVARTICDLAEIQWHRGDYAGSEKLNREEIAIYRRIYGRDHHELGGAMTDLATTLEFQGRFAEAEAAHREALAMQRRIGRDVGLSANNFAAFLRVQGRYKEAEPLSREVCTIWTEGTAKAFALQNLGIVLFELGEFEEAERLLHSAIGIWTDMFGTEDHHLAKALIGLGELEQFRGRYAESERAFAQAVDIRRDILGSEHDLTAESLVYLAGILHASGKPGAEPLYVEAIDVLRRTLGDRHAQVSWALSGLADLKKDSGDLDAAEALYREAIDIERSIPREKHPVLASCLTGFADVLLERGNPANAEPMLREAVDIRESRYSEGDPRTAETRGLLGECMVALESLDEAEPLLREACPILAAATGPHHRLSERVRQQLHDLYQSTNRPDLALPYAAQTDDPEGRDPAQVPELAVSGDSSR